VINTDENPNHLRIYAMDPGKQIALRFENRSLQLPTLVNKGENA
jgi:hypothetical protein